ncbi:protein abrupt-like [Adelges cooleyi]|uniref:protein abrupt-like n=1 Tax=Adelges cooleyi TaxID=133065 RepID=UPI00217F553A|nr:protein abrupt-like [Adelges cooleyi]
MSYTNEEYCLKWENHSGNLTEVLSSFLKNENLVDVTIACHSNFEKLHMVKAHQMVLSACSSYFEQLFLQNSHPHPIVYLRGVSYEQMEIILDFMYKGQVTVKHEIMEEVLCTARSLMVRGLGEESSPIVDKRSLPEYQENMTNTKRIKIWNKKNTPDHYTVQLSQDNQDMVRPIMTKPELHDDSYDKDTVIKQETSSSMSAEENYEAKENAYSDNNTLIDPNISPTSHQMELNDYLTTAHRAVYDNTLPEDLSCTKKTKLQATEAQHQQVRHRFRADWLKSYNWLAYDCHENIMFCKSCRRWSEVLNDVKTSFAKGSCNFRREILNHHARSKAHKNCMAKEIDELNRSSSVHYHTSI